MALKVNEIVIQAKITEDTSSYAATPEKAEGPIVPQSVKQEIIDRCMEKVKEYLDRHLRDARR
jgi:hypothetical protein